jgi:glycosyltransferase involved in cell wall biosynthesis
MKLLIQIPCLNEENSLPVTLADLPKAIAPFEEIEVLVIDDGSTDATAATAIDHGAHHVVRHRRNLGLARAFITGLHACLDRDADVIVNLDADNQYCAADIVRLTEPITSGRADMVIGTRPIANIVDFSPLKKRLQKLGSSVVRWVSGVSVDDAPSGFRAFSRDAASKLNVFGSYTYTIETIIQAGHLGLAIETVPIRVNRLMRPSRLVRSIPSYIFKSVSTMARVSILYRPLKFFFALGSVFLLLGSVIGVRFLAYYLMGSGDGKIQSLLLGTTLGMVGVQMFALGIIADIVAVNRKLLEKTQVSLANLKSPRPRPEQITRVLRKVA